MYSTAPYIHVLAAQSIKGCQSLMCIEHDIYLHISRCNAQYTHTALTAVIPASLISVWSCTNLYSAPLCRRNRSYDCPPIVSQFIAHACYNNSTKKKIFLPRIGVDLQKAETHAAVIADFSVAKCCYMTQAVSLKCNSPQSMPRYNRITRYTHSWSLRRNHTAKLND